MPSKIADIKHVCKIFNLGEPMSTRISITAQGQVTFRRALRQHMGIKPGQKIDVALLPNGRIELRPITDSPRINKVRGALWRPGLPLVSVLDLQHAINRRRS